MKTKLLGAVAALAISAVVSPAGAFGFLYNSDGTYTTLGGPPGSTFSSFTGLNNSGQLVGNYNTFNCNNCGNSQYGFLYTNGSFTTLNVPGSTYTSVSGINDYGQIVGNYSTGSTNYGFLYSNGTYTTLNGPPGYTNSFFSGINNSGQIVGSTGVGFVYSNGNYNTFNVPSAGYTAASGINNLGQIVGNFNNAAGTAKFGFLYSNGTYTTITSPSDPTNTWAVSINDLGQIIVLGGSSNTDFLYNNGVFTVFALGPEIHSHATGINNLGQIVGNYSGGPGDVPLPATLPLFATGLAALGLLGWRRKRKAQAAA